MPSYNFLLTLLKYPCGIYFKIIGFVVETVEVLKLLQIIQKVASLNLAGKEQLYKSETPGKD